MSKQEELDGLYGQIKVLLEGLKYGTITLVVQDGKVIQLEKKVRK